MGNTNSIEEDDLNSAPRTRAEPEPEEPIPDGGLDFDDKPVVAPRPQEERTDPNIIENLDQPLDDDKFKMGVTTNYEEFRDTILKNSRDEGKQYVFHDTEFPAEKESLYFSRQPSSKWDRITEWKRPHDLTENPRLLQDGITSDDIMQGTLGNCWWLSSVAAISRNPTCMHRVVPTNQAMTGDDYVGMFHFRFWRFGSWVEVIVDDRLPVIQDQLAFGRSSSKDEFWLSLLEKAYAKLHGSYEAIEGGFSQDGLEDLTGGMAVSFDLGDKTPGHLFRSLVKAFQNNSFACCSIKGSGEREDSRGLVSAHAYTITGATTIPFRGAKVKLVRIRNPWGNKIEWNQAWSDGSPLWDEVDRVTKDRIGYADKDNGEWWMEFSDFKKYFADCTICTMGPDFDIDGAATGDSWFLSKIKGKWIKSYSAGGCRNEVDKYAINPQYYMELREPDDFNPTRDDPANEGKCSIVLGLMQEYRRIGREDGLENLYLGINIYRLSSKPDRRLPTKHFLYNRDVVNSGNHIDKREVSITTELEPGHYVVIPSTFYPDKVSTFLLRIFTEKRIDLEELH
uniref:calpain-A-like n=1 Tax=Styela clava TaxID=7725 RepID=UPI001939F652|nr:calpain-A-like [Styela clava]